jgi:hypothetical protein
MKYKDEDPDNLGGLGDLLPAEVLSKFNGNIVFNIYKSGSQHVDNIQTQIIETLPQPQQKKETLPQPLPKGRGENTIKDEPFDDDTPLSALFRENHHEELRKVIESWRPYMVHDLSDMDALQLYHFEFNLAVIRPVSIYMDLVHLVNHDALRPPMSILAAYIFQHSNLSQSKNALYVQLKRYKKMCE